MKRRPLRAVRCCPVGAGRPDPTGRAATFVHPCDARIALGRPAITMPRMKICTLSALLWAAVAITGLSSMPLCADTARLATNAFAPALADKLVLGDSTCPFLTDLPPTKPAEASVGFTGFRAGQSPDSPDDPLPSFFHPIYASWFKTAHVTPYGLVIADKGVTIGQTLAADFDLYRGTRQTPINRIYIAAGLITYINGQTQQKSYIDGVNELEPFAGLYVRFLNCLVANVKYKEFYSVYNHFQTIDQTQIGLALDDSRWLKPVSLRPFMDMRLARHDDYLLLGLSPTVHLKPAGVAVTLTMPTWVTIGPPDFWGGLSHAGVFTTGLTAIFPLTFIPRKFGAWHFDAGVQYYSLLAHSLIRTSQFIGTGGHRNIVVGFTGFGVHF